MGFGPNFWRWITLLYSDPRTVIRLGLLTSEPFVVGRGTRQGCPLSPFLFALMMEPIARALRQSREVGAIQVGSIQENLTLYADDLLLFLRDPRTSLQAALRILDRFASFSGLRVNWTKSLILPVEPEAQKKKDHDGLPLQWVSAITYLGVKVTAKIRDYIPQNLLPLIPRLTQKIQAWKKTPIISNRTRKSLENENLASNFVLLKTFSNMGTQIFFPQTK